MQEEKRIYKEDLVYIQNRLEENNLTNYKRIGLNEFVQAHSSLPKPKKIKQLSNKMNIIEYSDGTMKISYANHRGKMYEFYYYKADYVQN